MNTIEILNETLITNETGAQFILLGDEKVTKSNLLSEAISLKIQTKNIDELIPGFWGTLGMEDDAPINFTGNLSVSKYGNDFSSGEVLNDIIGLYNINNLLDNKENKVIERFINFDEINFKDFELKIYKNEVTGEISDNIPKLRLTIFLAKDDGALAFYEHSKSKFDRQEEKNHEYILPQDEPLNGRDRITYIFPILTKYQITDSQDELSFGVELNKSFVIKVLTFKRDNSNDNPSKTLKSIINYTNTKSYNSISDGESSKYSLLKFDENLNEFMEVNYETVTVDTNLKTLLLLHGTFATTATSFEGLISKQYDGNKLSWLQKTISDRKYDQILAFDHPTITEDAEQNVNVLFNRLNGVDFTNKPIDILTTSRGGLVAKYLICLSESSTLPVRKAAFIACANGSGYFITGAHIGKLLGAFKFAAKGSPIGSIILGIAQFSVNTFLKMPGCQLMTPGHQRLSDILNAVPKPINYGIKIQPIVGDWDKVLVEGFIKRMAEQGLDLIIQLMLGKQNDWVIGTDNQKILPSGYLTYAPLEVKSLHTNYLNNQKTIGDVHLMLNTFFI